MRVVFLTLVAAEFLPGFAPGPRRLADEDKNTTSPTPPPTPAPTPVPTPEVFMCKGEESQVNRCNTDACYVAPTCYAVDGLWADWGEWSHCQCSGVTERQREVLLHHSCGGVPLRGAKTEAKGCEIVCDETFPIDCTFAQWGPWSFCDKDCGTGQQFRMRAVETPSINCGKACDGGTKETKACKEHKCGVANDCLETDWSDWSPCSVSCDGGQQMRQRGILHEATGEGAGCTAPLAATRPCHETCCDGAEQIDCKYAEWQDWGACSRSCDGGHRMRQRHLDQLPHHGGAKCAAQGVAEMEPCNQRLCDPIEPVDAAWGPWGDWSLDGTPDAGFCSVSCGGGYQMRSRVVALESADGGQPANGPLNEFQTCAHDDCPVEEIDCFLAEWSDWGDCSAPYNGVMGRDRSIAVHSAKGGKPCAGALRMYHPCNVDKVLTPVSEAELSQWGEWSQCTVSCDGGSKQRSRYVKSPGVGADGALVELVACGTVLCCPECDKNQNCAWNDWSDWSACSTTCDGGEHKRTRGVGTLSKNHGKPCEAQDSYEVGSCNLQKCDGGAVEYCVWADWGVFSECTAPCGGGTNERVRKLQMSAYPPADGGYLSAMSLVEEELTSVAASVASKNQLLCGMCGVLIAAVAIVMRQRPQTTVSPGGEALLESE